MANRIKNRPKVRFGGFLEDWEVNNFDNTFIGLPNNTLSRAELNYDSGLAKNIHYGDILIKFGEILDLEKSQVPYISNAYFVDKLQKSKLENGDIIIADAAEDEIVGKCTEIVNIGKETVFAGLHTIAIRPKFSFASMYLGYYMNSSAYHNQLLKLMQGTKVLSVSKTAIKTTIINNPPTPPEQQKIGSYFQNIDQLINLQQQKQDKLLILKKAMLSKMFPKEGATVPEIRFKGFTEVWEEKELKEISTYHSSSLTVSDAKVSGKNELYDVNKVIGFTNKNIQPCDYITIIKDGSGVGRIRLLPKNTSFIATMGAIRNANVDIYFLFYCLSRTDFRQHINGATIPHVYYSDYGNNIYYTPIEKEQKQIGTYFQNLDNLIGQHKEKLAKLKQLKKSCLAQMFV